MSADNNSLIRKNKWLHLLSLLIDPDQRERQIKINFNQKIKFRKKVLSYPFYFFAGIQNKMVDSGCFLPAVCAPVYGMERVWSNHSVNGICLQLGTWRYLMDDHVGNPYFSCFCISFFMANGKIRIKICRCTHGIFDICWSFIPNV